MNMKTISLIVFGFLFVSCGNAEFQFDAHTGTDGLMVEFQQNAPPDEFYTTATGEPLEIAMQVANRGAFDVSTAFLSLATERDYVIIDGWDQRSPITILGSNQERIAFPMKGKSLSDPFGTDEVFTTYTTAKINDPQVETLPTQVLAAVCYPYRTELHTPVCIDTDPNNLQNRRKSCGISSLSFSGQGAPVAVTAIEERILPSGTEFVRPQFIITIENVGGGTVLSADPDLLSQACSDASINAKRFNTVKLSEVSLSGFSLSAEQFDCQPVTIQLLEGTAEVTCTLKPGLLKSAQDTYSTDLAVTLDYGYMTTAAAAFRLTRST